MVLFDDVLLRYGAGPDILHNVSFSLAPGSFHFLVGSSGAGKSSLLRVMYLALRPIGGRASLFGRDVAQLSRHEIAEMRRRIGVVFQDFRLIDHLSAVDNVALPLRILGQRESEVQKECARAARLGGAGRPSGRAARNALRRPAATCRDRTRGHHPAQPVAGR